MSAEVTIVPAAPQDESESRGAQAQRSGATGRGELSTKSSPVDDHFVWNVSRCKEFGRRDQNARGRYIVDTSRGFDGQGEPLFINQGGFGISVDVVDLDDQLSIPHILRISNDEEAFEKLIDISRTVNEALLQRKSPFFLRTRTAFSCGDFPSLPGTPWEEVGAEVAKKFLGFDYFSEQFSVTEPVPIRLFYLIIERAELFDLGVGPFSLWDTITSLDDRVAHGESALKRSMIFQLVQGVATLNELGVAHRDIKLRNIVLSQRRFSPPSDSFLLEHPMPAGRQSQSRNYLVPRFDSIDDRVETMFRKIFNAAGGGFITPHLIDFDLALRVVSSIPGVAVTRSGQGAVRREDLREGDTGATELSIRYSTKRVRGSLTNIAPELIFLSFVGYNDDIDTLFKPDTFSLGVVIGELLTGFEVTTLLSRAGIKDSALDWKKVSGLTIGITIATAYSGFPSIGDIREYENAFESKVSEIKQKTEQLDENDEDRIEATRQSLRRLETLRSRLNDIVAGRKADWFKEEFGIEAARFQKGVLFETLERQVSAGLIRAQAIPLLRRMLDWDFQRRPNCAEILNDEFFDTFLVRDYEAWTLEVPQSFPVPLRVPSESGAPTQETSRQATVRWRRSSTIGRELVRGHCMRESCARTAVLEYRSAGRQKFCSKKCAELYWYRQVVKQHA